jgi:hypothetical protein
MLQSLDVIGEIISSLFLLNLRWNIELESFLVEIGSCVRVLVHKLAALIRQQVYQRQQFLQLAM